VPHFEKIVAAPESDGTPGPAKALKATVRKAGSPERIPRRRPCHLHDSTPKRGDFRTSEGTWPLHFRCRPCFLEEGEDIKLSKDIIWSVFILPVIHHVTSPWTMKTEVHWSSKMPPGFMSPEKDALWPNYFESLRITATASRNYPLYLLIDWFWAINGVVSTGARAYFEKVMKVYRSLSHGNAGAVADGEDIEKIATDKAQWVNSITDIQTYDVMFNMAKLLIKKSHTARKAQTSSLYRMPRKQVICIVQWRRNVTVLTAKILVWVSVIKQGLSYKVPERSEWERGAAPLKYLLPRHLWRGSQRVRTKWVICL